jgi:hypothetical protein
MLGSLVLTV